VEWTLRYLDPIAPDTREQIHHLSRALVNKLLHDMTIHMKEMAHSDHADQYISALRDIFGLAGGLPLLPPPEDTELRAESSRN
jgi:glutamyl-tRNA reductase